MSSLISKIEQKLGGSSSNEEQSKLQKNPPSESSGGTSNWATRTTGNDSGAPESVRHPISSTSGPTGTAVDHSYATSRDPAVMPGVQSSNSAAYRDVEPRQTHNPHSAEGSHLAAYTTANKTGGTVNYVTPQTQSQQMGAPPGATTTDTGMPSREIQPGMPSTTTAGYTKPTAHHHPITGNTMATTETTSGQHTADYSRDAGNVGGSAGGTGLGASNVSYMNRDTISGSGGQSLQDPNRRAFLDDSAGIGGAGAMGANTSGGTGIGAGSNLTARDESADAMAKKMSDAYQAGYRDGVEHMKSDMQRR